MTRIWRGLVVGVCGILVAGCAAVAMDESLVNEEMPGIVSEEAGAVPDINGLWQAVGTAHWNLEGGHAIKGPATLVLGALGGIPAGHNYLGGGEIPYTEEAAAKRAEYRLEWSQWDPAVKCFIPGIPRQTYMPLPFHIVLSRRYLLHTNGEAIAASFI